jgi:hypothetical protein
MARTGYQPPRQEQAYLRSFKASRSTPNIELANDEKDRDGSNVALQEPTGIAVDPSNIAYFMDTGVNKIHGIDKQVHVTVDYPRRYSEAYVTTLCALAESTRAPHK